MNQTDLSKFNNSWYRPGANFLVRTIWLFTNACFFNSWFPVNGLKIFLLRIFGAKVGYEVIIKPRVNIKYPWRLTIGDFSWIGEGVWIDNLDNVVIGAHVCVSQEAMLLTGNHNYSKSSFDLITKPIYLENGSWIGAKAVVCPGVICGSHSVLSVGSIATKDLEAFGIYSGNPAVKIKQRVISS